MPTKKSKKAKTMEELLASTGYEFRSFKRGDSIKAKLTGKEKTSATFDVGGKSEAVLVDEYFEEVKDFVDTLKIGQTVKATIMDPETREGRILLSLRSAAQESFWERLKKAKEEDKIIKVRVKGTSDAGLTADLEGLTGFIPSSHLGSDVAKNPEKYIDKSLAVKVIEVDKRKKRAVFSEKMVSEPQVIENLKKAVKKLKVGEEYEAVVTQVTGFGVFVEINLKVGKTKVPIEGLVHISEISWEKVDSASDVLSEGDKVKVELIELKEVDEQTGSAKVAFSIKQTKEDPWESVAKKYKPEDKVEGEIVKISDFGAFVLLEPGVEGLIHVTKIPPTKKLKKGDKVNCYVEEVDEKEKRISLGLVLTTKPVGYK